MIEETNVKRIYLDSPSQVNTEHYQLMPEADADRFAALVEDIERRGIRNPLLLDGNYNVIDGNTRVRAWEVIQAKGGDIPPVPAEVTTFEGELSKRTEARRQNALQRPLTFKNRETIVIDQLKEVTYSEEDGTVVSWSNARVGSVAGVGYKMPKRLREDMEAAGTLPIADITVSASGARESRATNASKGAAKQQNVTRQAGGDASQNTVTVPREEYEQLAEAAVSGQRLAVMTTNGSNGPEERPALDILRERGITVGPRPDGPTPGDRVHDAARELERLARELNVQPEEAARSFKSIPSALAMDLLLFRELQAWLTRFVAELEAIHAPQKGINNGS